MSQPVSGIAEIIRHFEKVGENFERGGKYIPKKISESWQLMIHLTDAIDSGDYLRAVDVHPVQGTGDFQEYVVDTSNNPAVVYEGLVEGGTKYMTARFPAEKAIEREDFVTSIMDFVEKGLR